MSDKQRRQTGCPARGLCESSRFQGTSASGLRLQQQVPDEGGEHCGSACPDLRNISPTVILGLKLGPSALLGTPHTLLASKRQGLNTMAESDLNGWGVRVFPYPRRWYLLIAQPSWGGYAPGLPVWRCSCVLRADT